MRVNARRTRRRRPLAALLLSRAGRRRYHGRAGHRLIRLDRRLPEGPPGDLGRPARDRVHGPRLPPSSKFVAVTRRPAVPTVRGKLSPSTAPTTTGRPNGSMATARPGRLRNGHTSSQTCHLTRTGNPALLGRLSLSKTYKYTVCPLANRPGLARTVIVPLAQ
jgi:hypothetical protein